MSTATTFHQNHKDVLHAAIENFQVVCSWCQTITKEGNPELVSHTICDGCTAKMIPAPKAITRLTFEQYVASVVEVIVGKRFHVASSSRPSSVREVVMHEDGRLTCSCPARVFCVHRKAVIEATAPVELAIAPMPQPCRCCGCRSIDPNPAGCIFGGTVSDHQAMNAIAA